MHRRFQELSSRHAQALGYDVNIEHRLEGRGSVDVDLGRQGVRIAVEIAVESRADRECGNIEKCLEAGYDRVLALFLNPTLLHDAKLLFTKTASNGELARVTFLEVERLMEEIN